MPPVRERTGIPSEVIDPVIIVPVEWADDAKIIGYVFERDGHWFKRPKGWSWHLLRPTTWKAWCGLEWEPRTDATRIMHVTWPWQDRGCYSCMDRRWQRGIR